MVPGQEKKNGQDQADPQGNIVWQAIRLQGQDRLAIRASNRLVRDELLLTKFAGAVLRLHLDRVPLWRGNHVGVKQLTEDFAQYLYLPRLKTTSMIIDAVVDGISLLGWKSDTFAYASSWDDKRERYIGLQAGQSGVQVIADSSSMVVKSEIAFKQIESETPEKSTGVSSAPDSPSGDGQTFITVDGKSIATPTSTRFFGTVKLDPTRVGRDAGKIAENVIQHLSGLVGCDVNITLEIEATLRDGVEDRVEKIVTENCRTLKFKDFGFHEE